MKQVLTSRLIELGIEEFCINLELLYPVREDLIKFNMRWRSFYESNYVYNSIFTKKNNFLIYQSENLIPTKRNKKPPVLLVFGNPASQSVVSRMCFAFESNMREHRIWPALRKTGWLTFFSDKNTWINSWENRNKQRKKEFYELEYDSPFCLGITVALSLPSPSSEKTWAGVVGVKKLFGRNAFRTIETYEKERLAAIIKKFIGSTPNGCVLAFQRDAYEFLRSPTSPHYSLTLAKLVNLVGQVSAGAKSTPLVGLPPTRYAHTNNFETSLNDIKERILSNNI